jgi:hypothetical protein
MTDTVTSRLTDLVRSKRKCRIFRTVSNDGSTEQTTEIEYSYMCTRTGAETNYSATALPQNGEKKENKQCHEDLIQIIIV